MTFFDPAFGTKNEDVDDEDVAPAPRRGGRARKPAVVDNEDVEEEELAPLPRKSVKGKKKSVAAAASADDEEDTTRTVKLTVVGGAVVDSQFHSASSYHVYCDASGPWDFTGNQTNIANNNNKYYIIQLLEKNGGGDYKTWTRWGRVGYVRTSLMYILFGTLAPHLAHFYLAVFVLRTSPKFILNQLQGNRSEPDSIGRVSRCGQGWN